MRRSNRGEDKPFVNGPPGIASPAASVVICAFNVAPYIRESVTSALGQTFEDIEVIVIDDGSTDDGVAQLEGIRDPRLRVFKRPHSGHGASLNAGIGLARGDYIGLLDADDRWHPKKLERHLAVHASRPSVDMSYSLSEEIDVDGVPGAAETADTADFVSLRDLLIENVVRNGSAPVIRREALVKAGDFDEEIPSCQDLDMWLRIKQLRERNIYKIPEVLTQYRRRPRQVSSNVHLMIEGLEMVIAKVARFTPEEVAATEIDRSVKMNSYYAYLSYEAGEFGTGLRYLWRGVRISPSRFLAVPRNTIFLAACLAGMVLPRAWHMKLDRWIRYRRGPAVFGNPHEDVTRET